jgi:hypothetical protein
MTIDSGERPEGHLERHELGTISASLIPAIDRLRAELMAAVHGRSSVETDRVDAVLQAVVHANSRLGHLSVTMPAGPLEEFGRLHPQMQDAEGGGYYCGNKGRATGHPNIQVCDAPGDLRHRQAWALLSGDPEWWKK